MKKSDSQFKKIIDFLTTASVFFGTLNALVINLTEFLKNGQNFLSIINPIAYYIGLSEICVLTSFFILCCFLFVLSPDTFIILTEADSSVLSQISIFLTFFAIVIGIFLIVDVPSHFELLSNFFHHLNLPTRDNIIKAVNPIIFEVCGVATLLIFVYFAYRSYLNETE
ncbi:hypothetical protein [Brasilonema bromeliae]|uniref:NADH dehydrogenase subunit 6 n=1 Tax=Brasilonema bromeliae SPC951 TaxID=385972 RepID=A0ABX1P9M8_9CYAN|nr:hypothetical protein [Brasilonema bromeliae]NMG20192.1 hypothetical protein [Brasilonema bromeliae SPC951]